MGIRDAGEAAKPEFTIDAEFQSLIAPLTSEEFELLKAQILEQGCRDAISVWKTDDGHRILLDGHNRYKICAENKIPHPRVVNIRLASREDARLWILQHQAGRRNLTDDQRAVVWNEIQVQRSRIVQAQKLQKARDVKAGIPISVESTEIDHLKKDTRAEVAVEAKLSESKLRRVKHLKINRPDLYEKVLSGELTLRNASQKSAEGHKTGTRKDQDYFCRIGRTLDGIFKGALKEKLEVLAHLKQENFTPVAEKGLRQITETLHEVSEHADGYATKFKAILQTRKKVA
jgi:hypothetical protein